MTAAVLARLVEALGLPTISATTDPRLRRLPFQWDDTGSGEWEDLVNDVYRIDNAIRSTVVKHVNDHDEAKSASRRNEDEISCWC